jgi:hypothetical protein
MDLERAYREDRIAEARCNGGRHGAHAGESDSVLSAKMVDVRSNMCCYKSHSPATAADPRTRTTRWGSEEQ